MTDDSDKLRALKNKKINMISDSMNVKYCGKKEKEKIQKSLSTVKRSCSNGSITQDVF